MQTIILFPEKWTNSSDMHASFKLLFNLPDYYGANADALHDCLSEFSHPLQVITLGEVPQALARAYSACVNAMEDAGVKFVPKSF